MAQANDEQATYDTVAYIQGEELAEDTPSYACDGERGACVLVEVEYVANIVLMRDDEAVPQK